MTDSPRDCADADNGEDRTTRLESLNEMFQKLLDRLDLKAFSMLAIAVAGFGFAVLMLQIAKGISDWVLSPAPIPFAAAAWEFLEVVRSRGGPRREEHGPGAWAARLWRYLSLPEFRSRGLMIRFLAGVVEVGVGSRLSVPEGGRFNPYGITGITVDDLRGDGLTPDKVNAAAEELECWAEDPDTVRDTAVQDVAVQANFLIKVYRFERGITRVKVGGVYLGSVFLVAGLVAAIQ